MRDVRGHDRLFRGLEALVDRRDREADGARDLLQRDGFGRLVVAHRGGEREERLVLGRERAPRALDVATGREGRDAGDAEVGEARGALHVLQRAQDLLRLRLARHDEAHVEAPLRRDDGVDHGVELVLRQGGPDRREPHASRAIEGRVDGEAGLVDALVEELDAVRPGLTQVARQLGRGLGAPVEGEVGAVAPRRLPGVEDPVDGVRAGGGARQAAERVPAVRELEADLREHQDRASAARAAVSCLPGPPRRACFALLTKTPL
jgi:hypothetical protein